MTGVTLTFLFSISLRVMSSPPRYSDPEDDERLDESHLLLKTPAKYDTATTTTSSSSTHSYPPTSRTRPEDHQRSSEFDAPGVIYVYTPAGGSKRRVMSILPRTKAETIEKVQNAFPLLADVNPNRIQFETLVNPGSPIVEQRWAIVLDEAWAKLVESKPETLILSLLAEPLDPESAGAALKKTKRRTTMIRYGFVAVLSFFAGVVFMAATRGDAASTPDAIEGS
ncbi:hypothetical protein BD324DRAFT_653201 [Kockovaella imperatae]|uniref:Transmembrane protein n=1 Tax=Kockovaella imperatae TaxID=4999 RepID=A0A1Y1UA48_9TREE|nr:hypothetical protein BD324DRAFT_653201 [Kockovaella imperatae]ORX34424.1 hypothetical protein BD324DRAFT_653201 [Kockovaella imperatae]